LSSCPYNTPQKFPPRVCGLLYTLRLPTRPAADHSLLSNIRRFTHFPLLQVLSERPGLVPPAHVERPPLHRGGSVSSCDQARPLLTSPLKPLNDKNRKGVCRTLDCARPTRAFGGRALREQESLADALPTPLSSRLFYFPNAFFSSGSISPLAAIGSRMSVSP
jgi:hypothetical protein